MATVPISGATASTDESPAAGAANSENVEEPIDAESANADAADAGFAEGEAGEDDLPDWEPLTPEFVEDEAIRGDFMLRWCVILLAFLLGCRAISDTMTLVRIRSGEQIVDNSLWPRFSDTFSYTAAGRVWTNPAWLFDVVLSTVFGVAGPVGLTLLTAVIAGATFYLIAGISRAGIPTWWSSICAAIALLAMHLEFAALPQMMTMLGTAWILNGLYRWSENGNTAVLKCLVVSLAVWSNLDERAFVGWLLMAAFAIGSAMADRRGRWTHHADAATRDLIKAAAAGFVALMINPFGWKTVLMPFSLFGYELSQRVAYAGAVSTLAEFRLLSIADSRVWLALPYHVLAACAVAALAIVTGLMNRRRFDAGLATAALALSVLTLFSLQELPAAVIALCVLAALNGQDWYRANCRLDYSIETLEVLWSRAGRAITVLSLAGVAWLAISGRLAGPHDKRGTFGFSERLATKIEGTAADLADTYDGRIFTFRPDHGDLLIWSGKPCFIDSRLRLYLEGDENLLELHNRTRYALRLRPQGLPPGLAANGSADLPTDASGAGATDSNGTAAGTEAARGTAPSQPVWANWFDQPDVWKATFDRFDISLVAPRLWGTVPNYDSYFDLAVQPEWMLIRLGSTMALFARPDRDDPKLNAFLTANASEMSFVSQAFRACRHSETKFERFDWPRPRTTYQSYLSLPVEPESNATARARHQLAHLNAALSGGLQVTQEDAYSLAYLIVRDVNTGLASNISDRIALHTLGTAYSILQTMERGMSAASLPGPAMQRHYQRLYALRQALVLEPDDLDVLSSLIDLHLDANQWDLAMDAATRAIEVIRNRSIADATALSLARQFNQVRQELQARTESLEQQLEPLLANPDANRFQIAFSLHQQGFPRRALEILDEDRIALGNDPGALLERAVLLCEAGRFEEADAQFSDTEALANSTRIDLFWILHGAWIQMAHGDYESAIQRCRSRIRDIELGSIESLLELAPFVQPRPLFSGDNNIWPVTLTTATTNHLLTLRSELTQLRWTIATACLESGRCADATATLQELIDTDPETPMRPAIAFLLRALTDRQIPLIPESEMVPILFTDGPEDPLAPADQPDQPAEPDAKSVAP